MFDLFGLGMRGNYQERLIANDTVGEVEIDTVRVTDSEQPYETGIQSRLYNQGGWIIVQMYDTHEEAKKGHQEWMERMKNPPTVLEDVSTSQTVEFLKAIGGNLPPMERA